MGVRNLGGVGASVCGTKTSFSGARDGRRTDETDVENVETWKRTTGTITPLWRERAGLLAGTVGK